MDSDLVCYSDRVELTCGSNGKTVVNHVTENPPSSAGAYPVLLHSIGTNSDYEDLLAYILSFPTSGRQRFIIVLTVT